MIFYLLQPLLKNNQQYYFTRIFSCSRPLPFSSFRIKLESPRKLAINSRQITKCVQGEREFRIWRAERSAFLRAHAFHAIVADLHLYFIFVIKCLKMNVDILAPSPVSKRTRPRLAVNHVMPGDVITTEPGFMRYISS